MTPDKHKPRKTNWLMIILVVLVALIAFQMQVDRKERQDRIDRQNSFTCFVNPNQFACR